MDTKVCTYCNKELPTHSFDTYPKNGKRYVKATCITCSNIKQRVWRKENKEKVKEQNKRSNANRDIEKRREFDRQRHHKRNYGISRETFEKECARLNNQCEICNTQVKTLHVDHCHEEGHNRGLLCGNCNRALGMMKDSTKILANAIKYLERNGNEQLQK